MVLLSFVNRFVEETVVLGSWIRSENQLANLETLFTICKVQVNKDIK